MKKLLLFVALVGGLGMIASTNSAEAGPAPGSSYGGYRPGYGGYRTGFNGYRYLNNNYRGNVGQSVNSGVPRSLHGNTYVYPPRITTTHAPILRTPSYTPKYSQKYVPTYAPLYPPKYGGYYHR